MTSARHSKQTLSQGIHSSISLEYADAAERVAQTEFDTGDLYKLAIQLDDFSIWLLYDLSPISWAQISSGVIPQILFTAAKSTSGTINKGQVVYIAGYDSINARTTVELARSDSMSTMPAVGIAAGTITDVVAGTVMIIGFIENIDTSSFAINDRLFVSSTVAGSFTATAPSGPNVRQDVSIVLKSHATTGIINVHINDISTLSNSAPASIGATSASGTAATSSRSDHTHAVTDLLISSEAQGDVLYFNGANWVRLAASTDGYFLQTHSTSQNPTWSGELKTTLDAKSKDIIDAKTITFAGEYSNGTSGASKLIDWNNGQKQLLTLSDTTVLSFAAPRLGVTNLLLRIVQDSTPRTITWPGTVKWVGAAAPTISTASGAIDIFSFYWNGTNYYGVASLNFA